MPKPIKASTASTSLSVNEAPCAKAGCVKSARVSVFGNRIWASLQENANQVEDGAAL